MTNMDNVLKAKIKKLVSEKIDAKLSNYTAETEYVPFFEAIFERRTIVQASIMQSLYTSFGMSIYEQMGVLLALSAGYHAERQYDLLGDIDERTETLISQICQRSTRNKAAEVEEIRRSVQQGSALKHAESRVDLRIVKPDGEEVYIDITTVKPNLKEFRSLRAKMLRWCALRFSQKNEANVQTYIGIPYNPYFPQPYERWTGKICDPQEILVQNDLWHEIAGYDVFNDLLVAFSEVGTEMRSKISSFLENRG